MVMSPVLDSLKQKQKTPKKPTTKNNKNQKTKQNKKQKKKTNGFWVQRILKTKSTNKYIIPC